MLGSLKPYPKNAKKHPKKQIEQVANSIKEFGFNQPIVVDKNNVVIVGHGRLEAAKLLKMKEVPTLQVDLTEEQAKAYRLADNKLNESDWEMDLVIDELKELSEGMFDLTGFDKGLIIEPEDRDDEVPDVPEEPTSKLGEIYQLGEHRVHCGDSTKIEDVEKLMDGNKADCSFTSPPYNVGHNLGYEGKESKYNTSDDNLEDYRELIIKTTRIAMSFATDVFVNLQFLANNKKDLALYLAELADWFKDIFFWKKRQVAPAAAMNVANSQTEVVFLFGEDGEEQKKEWVDIIGLYGMNTTRRWGNKKFRGTFSNIIETKSASTENKNAKIHNATMPVALPLEFFKKGYQQGSVIIDLFAGTGTTMIAAEKLQQKCYMMELDPKYVDVIIKRYEDYTGNKAIKL